MNSYEENYINLRPQSLCKMCGKCCRVVTNVKYTYDDIRKMAESQDEYAMDFINIFEPYPSIEDAKKVDKKTVEYIIEKLKADGKYDENNLTFYRCKYILNNNKCSIYEERPKLCIYSPASAWTIVPPGCGFEPWLFLKREETMQKVRKAKEELLELKIMRRNTTDEKILQKIESVEKKIRNTIEKR